MRLPADYFHNNVAGFAALLQTMEAAGVRRMVYSSSAAVYGTQLEMPIAESAALNPESPYGLTKVHGEQMLDWMVRQNGWAAVSLRYFNPVGAHASGRIGQPIESARALVPRALHALLNPSAPLTVFGTDWPTPDGSALRDYIHIRDLARAHLVALDAVGGAAAHHIFNVGTGRPHSVLEVLATCERIAGRPVPAVFGPRRAGDMACATANPARFEQAFAFRAELGLEDMVASAWKWAVENPRGYDR